MIRAGILALLLGASSAMADPIFSIAGTMDATNDYDVVLDAFQTANVDATSLTVFWDDLETNGRYSPDPDWPAIANAVYPATGLQISLMISVIDTVQDRRPADLQGLPYADPAVIARFDMFLTEILRAMPNVQLTSIGIGNEVDGYLRGDAWEDYIVFFAAAKAVAQRERPGVPVGTTMTWQGLQTHADAQRLARLGDVWMVNYYPLTPDFRVEPMAQIDRNLAGMVAAAAPQQVYLTETGYPSDGCDGTLAGQATFNAKVWDFAKAHEDAMRLVNYVWLHDLSDEEVAGYTRYYGVSQPCFASYLASLGLRTRDGADKPGFTWMKNR